MYDECIADCIRTIKLVQECYDIEDWQKGDITRCILALRGTCYLRKGGSSFAEEAVNLLKGLHVFYETTKDYLDTGGDSNCLSAQSR